MERITRKEIKAWNLELDIVANVVVLGIDKPCEGYIDGHCSSYGYSLYSCGCRDKVTLERCDRIESHREWNTKL